MLWGAAATLQFIVINWAEVRLEMGLSSSSMLQGVVAIGVAVGAIMAARMVSLKKSVQVLPVGIALGIIVCCMNFVHDRNVAIVLLILIGGLSGFFVVPMNALLQHRGHILMGAGHSIAVQNFNENLSILCMTGMYYLMIKMDLSIFWIIALFGFFVSAISYLTYRRHAENQRQHDNTAYLEDTNHPK
jgi:cbb3-type cytochrome oxidase subunit 3